MARILIVEDSPTQAEKLKFVLEAEGFDVESAASAEAAIPLLSKSRFDMVVSDIVMPGLSGYELCHRIKTEFSLRDIPVALLTSLRDPMDIIRGLEAGADNFITKPYESDQLVARIRTILENKQIRSGSKLKLGVEIAFLGKTFTVNSDKEQILDLLIATFEDVVRTNLALHESEAELTAAKAEIERYAQQLERRVAERTAALAERQRQLAQAQEIAQLGSWRWDTRSDDFEWSDEMYRTFGIERGILQKFQDTVTLVHPDDRQKVTDTLNKAIADKASYPCEFRIIRQNGEERYCWMEAQCEFGEKGEITALFGICQDVTERKWAEAELREANELREAVIESSPVAIFTLGPDGEVTLWNPAAQKIFGYAREETIGRLHPVTPDEWVNEFRDMLERARKGEILRNVNVVRQRKDGRPLEVSLSAVPLHGPDGQLEGILCLADDRTEHREMQRQLTQAQKMEAVGQLTGGLAHDFNNLLGIIIGNLDLLQEYLKDHPEAAELADAAVRASLRGADLTRQLLAFSRRQPLQPKLVDMNELVSSMTKLLGRTLGENIEIELITASTPAFVMADPAQLESTLANLSINSRHAMPDGGALTIEVRHTQLDEDYVLLNPEAVPGDYVVLEVTDAGIGMPPEVLDRVFEPFFTTRPANEGTGLGLSQVYGFAKQSNGHIKIYSEVGQGTTVRLYLPRGDAKPHEEANDVAVVEEAEEARHEIILVVEDNIGLRDILTKHLSQLGYEYLEAENAKAALEILEQDLKIDLLFTDVVMPGGMSGYDLAREAVARHPNLKVLVTSGFPGTALSSGSNFAAGVDFLSKPYRKEELAKKLREVLSR